MSLVKFGKIPGRPDGSPGFIITNVNTDDDVSVKHNKRRWYLLKI